MPNTLSKDLRKLLERVYLRNNDRDGARETALRAARAALENLAVHEKDYRAHMTIEQRQLRNRLRARARALGDPRDEASGRQRISHLAEDIAYDQWHRLLFTRFLAENNLLRTDEENGCVPVTLDECEELAPELGAQDGFDLACRFAAQILPGVFRRNDPGLKLRLAANDEVELRKLLTSLPLEVFISDDSLGWTYQFWQAERKDEVNASGAKIGAGELAAVTQLFTEDYMVEFLLHNTLGAWWAGKLGPIQTATEEEARARAAIPGQDGVPAISWTYLRFVQDEATKTWLPAAGTLPGWPTAARLIRVLDPCMGSGHFLVFALPILVRLRMEEEKLSPAEAVVAVLRDNLHGLELDERCTQIAAFNVALASWKLAGYQALPPLHLACSGLAPGAGEAEWMALAGTGENSDRLQRGMVRLHTLFKDAPILGSLINPRAVAGDLIEAEFRELAPLLSTALALSEEQETKSENDAVELVVIAQGLAKAAELLAGQFTLVITNVPYLGRGNQDESLKDYCERVHAGAQADLAACFVERCLDFCGSNDSAALVTPQNWLFQGRYEQMRKRLWENIPCNLVAKLGPRAFETISGEIVNVALLTFSRQVPTPEHRISAIDVSVKRSAQEKAHALHDTGVTRILQTSQISAPKARLTLSHLDKVNRLDEFATALHGQAVGDNPSFNRSFWERESLSNGWEAYQCQPDETNLYGGRHSALHWENEKGRMAELANSVRHLNHKAQQWRSGKPNWGKRGVAVCLVGRIYATLYSGDIYAQSCCVIIPHDANDLPALYCFASSGELESALRRLDSSLGVSVKTVTSVPFDLADWQRVASEEYPNGLPQPYSGDPTQWLFNGHPAGSTQPLHVAVARLLGYRWPRQTGSNFPDCPALGPDGLESFADDDGIVCLPPLNHEQPAAGRLRQTLTAALGPFDERALIAAAGLKGSKSKTLEDWLRNECFEQHAKIFRDRPFLWHLWDGRADGFHAFINYHRLDYAMLQKLTYTYLGYWIDQQDEDAKADKPGAADRLGAARTLQSELAKILEGEPPYDIFVRWKPLSQQPTGWHPDLNDGVRLNIRPFLLAKDSGKQDAGILRVKPNIKWDKDRGNEPVRDKTHFPWFWCEEEPEPDPNGGKNFAGHRWNSVHLSLERKRKASARVASEKT